MYTLGIDAGATKSHVVLWEKTDQTNFSLNSAILDTSHPGINLDVISQEEASVRLNAILQEASRAIGKNLDDLLLETEVVFGMAGLDTELDQQNAHNWLKSFFAPGSIPAYFYLIPDVELALWAASENGTGVLLISGTGSNCFGRSQDGKTAKSGGLSHFFSDEGSGFMLGWYALHQVAQMYDGRTKKSQLYEQILRAYEVEDFAQLKRQIVQDSDYKHAVAKAAPVVQELATQGDPDSLTLIEQGAAHLSVMVQTVYRQLINGEPLPVYLVGGLFKHELYKTKLTDILSGMGISATTGFIEYPVLGALRYKK